MSQPRAGGKTAPRERRPQTRSTGKTAGIFGGAFVLLAVVIIVLVSLLGGSTRSANGLVAFAYPAPASYVAALANVPAAQFAAAGTGGGNVTVSFTATPKQAPITEAGKPVLVYIGAEFCPYCAADRWSLIVALSRFGTLSGLGTVGSSPEDLYASTRTFSFQKAHYSSPYLVFDPTELATNVCASAVVDNTCPQEDYKTLQTLSARDAKLVSTYDSGGGIPFFDWGGRWIALGPVYSPGLINLGNSESALGWHPLSWRQIISNIYSSKPMTPAGEGILGGANVYTAAICAMTHGQPASVCDTSAVRQAQKELPAS